MVIEFDGYKVDNNWIILMRLVEDNLFLLVNSNPTQCFELTNLLFIWIK